MAGLSGMIRNPERLGRMRAAMERARLDALILRLPENVLLLSGYWPMLGVCTLVFPREGSASILIPDYYSKEAAPSLWEAEARYFPFGVLGAPDPAEATREFLADCARGKGWRRVGYEGSFSLLAPSWQAAEVIVPGADARALDEAALGAVEFADASALLQTERQRKTPFEAEKLRIASEISCFGLELFQQMVGIGVSGVELVAAVEAEIMSRGIGYKGAERVRAWAQVAGGPEETAMAYRMNEISTTRRLQNGDAAMLELAVVADGYWADRTRVRVAGEPSEEQARVFATLVRAQEASVAAIRPGVTGAEVDEAARSLIREAGYEARFPHITGHGLGFAYHEAGPKMAPGSPDVLEEGMLTSVEPGIYFRPAGGFRVEDDVLVTAAGFEVLGEFPKEL
ncbi:MAG: Xaa-Pro peptidase family protein [Acidobacteriota bacterium]